MKCQANIVSLYLKHFLITQSVWAFWVYIVFLNTTVHWIIHHLTTVILLVGNSFLASLKHGKGFPQTRRKLQKVYFNFFHEDWDYCEDWSDYSCESIHAQTGLALASVKIVHIFIKFLLYQKGHNGMLQRLYCHVCHDEFNNYISGFDTNMNHAC